MIIPQSRKTKKADVDSFCFSTYVAMDVSRSSWYVVADLDRGGLPVSRWVFSRLLVTDGFDLDTYFINLFGNENAVHSAGQVDSQPVVPSTQSTCPNFGQGTNAISDINVNDINTAGQVDIQQLFQIGLSVGLQGEYLWNFICSSFQNAQVVAPVEQIVFEQDDCQLLANNGNTNTSELQGLFSQEKMDEFTGWDFNISLPDINVPSVVSVTPAPQTELTAPSGRVIPKTPKTPGKPRKKSSNSKSPKSPKSPSKKGFLKDTLFSPRVVSSS
ncbi:hypothetical protein C348_05859 [Cryptococcus neoformans Gb118]|nr:hypothetical protein C348_05859 [Cryptococcus neoformans var. grubii Gb118]